MFKYFFSVEPITTYRAFPAELGNIGAVPECPEKLHVRDENYRSLGTCFSQSTSGFEQTIKERLLMKNLNNKYSYYTKYFQLFANIHQLIH